MALKFKTGSFVKSKRGNYFHIRRARHSIWPYNRAGYEVKNVSNGKSYTVLATDAHKRWEKCDPAEVVLYAPTEV